MKRLEDNSIQDRYLEKVFSYLRGKNQGDKIQIRDQRTDHIQEVCFLRRGRINVSVFNPELNRSILVDLERVVLPAEGEI